jgi:transcriptional regulator with XRE-family HTH domain
MLFYEILKKVCSERGTSPSRAAVEAGLSKSAVTRWKNGQSPTVDVVLSIADYLDVDPAVLIPGRREK